MRLTRFTDISLRALMYLAAHEGRAVSTAEMAAALRVSRDHLMKSLQTLATLGLVEAARGRGGGFRLAPDGVSIPIGGVVRALERRHELAECFGERSTCPLTGGCRLAGVLREAESAFYDTLDAYTVADLLAANRVDLVQLGENRALAHH